MSPSFLIYHPKRVATHIGKLMVYHDNFDGNQDPYLWNDSFLHTYCHITQLSNKVGQINFWVSGDHYPDFTQLLCDCVFVVAQKCYLKADGARSFQPQDRNQQLIDIVPFLNRHGVATNTLIHAMTSRRGSRPFQLDDSLGLRLSDYLSATAAIKLTGKQLAHKHPEKFTKSNNSKC